MKHKPLIFKILMTLLFVEPLIKLLYFKASTQFDFSTIIENVMARNAPRDIFDFWLVFPLAGLMLVKIRKWSYFGFLFLLGYLVMSIATYEQYTWPYNSDRPLAYHYFVIAFSLAAFAYFLMPQVRAPFFIRRLRWWENKTRYKSHIPAKVSGSKKTFQTEILNISETGAFLADSEFLNPGDELEIEFKANGLTMELPIKVVGKHNSGNQYGYGVQFFPRTITQKFHLIRLIREIKEKYRD